MPFWASLSCSRGGTATLVLAACGERRVRVTVNDTGVGVLPEHQPTLFHPFHRAGQEFGNIEGTGIGLVITRRLAELMGGSVGFVSEPDVGSEFWVELPAVGGQGRPTPPKRGCAWRKASTGRT